jgi:hypothetical protein
MRNKDKMKEANKKTAFDELLLQGKDDPPGFAALWFSRDGNMGMHFYGYKNVTEILLNWFFEPNDDNGTVYPLIFLIRHTVELGLKESIRRAKRLAGGSSSLSDGNLKGVWKKHGLRFLSDVCEKLLEEYKISEYGDWIETKQFLQKWQDADPNATFGKYAVSTEGVPYDVKGNVYAGKIVVMGMKAIETLDGLLSMLEEYMHIQSDVYGGMRGEN